MTGVVMSAALIWISIFMGKEFEERSVSGIKVGDDEVEGSKSLPTKHEYSSVEMAETTNNDSNTNTNDSIEDTSCGVEEEGQSPSGTKKKGVISAMV